MGRKQIYAQNGEKQKAYYYKQNNIPFRVVNGLVVRINGFQDTMLNSDKVKSKSKKVKTIEEKVTPLPGKNGRNLYHHEIWTIYSLLLNKAPHGDKKTLVREIVAYLTTNYL